MLAMSLYFIIIRTFLLNLVRCLIVMMAISEEKSTPYSQGAIYFQVDLSVVRALSRYATISDVVHVSFWSSIVTYISNCTTAKIMFYEMCETFLWVCEV